MVNDAGYALLPIFSGASTLVTDTGGSYDIETTITLPFYTKDSSSTSQRRLSDSANLDLYEMDTLIFNHTYIDPDGIKWLTLACSDSSLSSIGIYLKAGSSTIDSDTSWSSDSESTVGGLTFRYNYDSSQVYDYAICLKPFAAGVDISNTANDLVNIFLRYNWSGNVQYRSIGPHIAVSNL